MRMTDIAASTCVQPSSNRVSQFTERQQSEASFSARAAKQPNREPGQNLAATRSGSEINVVRQKHSFLNPTKTPMMCSHVNARLPARGFRGQIRSLRVQRHSAL